MLMVSCNAEMKSKDNNNQDGLFVFTVDARDAMAAHNKLLVKVADFTQAHQTVKSKIYECVSGDKVWDGQGSLLETRFAAGLEHRPGVRFTTKIDTMHVMSLMEAKP